MTVEQRAELRELLASATRGPWENDGGGEIGQHHSCPQPWAPIVSTDVSCMAYCYGGTASGVTRDEDADLIVAAVNALPALLDAADERDRLTASIERVRELHRAVGIYDPCECTDEEKETGHKDVEEVGLTCNKLYDICAECCRDDVYQTETCAAYHDHKPGEAHHCKTMEALARDDS